MNKTTILFAALAFLLSNVFANRAQAQQVPSNDTFNIHIELNQSEIGECQSGWTIVTWDRDSHAVRSLPGEALDANIARWNGNLSIAAVCGRQVNRWNPFHVNGFRAGFRSILVDSVELVRSLRPVAIMSILPTIFTIALPSLRLPRHMFAATTVATNSL